MNSKPSNSTLSREFPDDFHWCNYPIITKSRNKLRNYEGYIVTNEYSFTELPYQEDDFSFISDSSPSATKSFIAEEESTLSASRKKSPVLYPVEDIVSPWLKFGLENDPWNESQFHQMPRLVTSNRVKGPLTTHTVASGILNLNQTPDTKAFAVTRLEVAKQELTDIEILRTFRCFQYVNISWNEISDLSPLENMIYLMCLNASHNKIKEVLNMKAPWYLTYVSLACNELTYISDLSEFWSLRHIDFSYNRIGKIQGLHNLKYLKYLNLSHNDIVCLENLNGLNIEQLYLEYNKIDTWATDDDGRIYINPQIKSINLSHNCLDTLSFLQGLYHLRELHVSHNLISGVEELDYFRDLMYLKNLSLHENKVSFLESYKSIILYYLPRLDVIDTVDVLSSEREAANIIYSPKLVLQRYRPHAKLLLYEQLATQWVKNDTQPSGAKSFPLVCLVGPHGSSKLSLAKRLAEEFGQFIYCARNHVMSSPNIGIYEEIINNDFVVTEEKFNEMLSQGEFLATSELIGFSYGLSRAEFARSIEEGKLCLTTTDLLMAFCLQAMGLNPHLILVMVKDIEIHQNRIMSAYTEPGAGSLLEVQFDNLLQKTVGTESYNSNAEEELKRILKEQMSTNEDENSSNPSITKSDSIKEPEKSSNENEPSIFDVIEELSRLSKFDIPNQEQVPESSKNHDTKSTSVNGTSMSSRRKSSHDDASSTHTTSTTKSRPTNEFLRVRLRSSSASKDSKSLSKDDAFSDNQSSDSKSEKHLSLIPGVLTSTKELNADGTPLSVDQLDMSWGSLSGPLNCLSCTGKGSPPKKPRQRGSLHADGAWNSSSQINRNKSCNDSMGDWSWTSSNELDELTEEETEPEEKTQSSISFTLKTIDYITQKIIDSRKVYQDLQKTGYFSHIINTDDVNEAYNELKNIIRHIYNSKDEWVSLISLEDDPLYTETVRRKTERLMNLLDKTESTASLKKQ